MPSPETDLGEPSRHDIFLSPHSDDICFSIGVLAHRRHAGTLLTLFPVTSYRADVPPQAEPRPRVTTRARLSEDEDFATECGLSLAVLGHRDAAARQQRPFDAAPAPSLSDAISGDLMRSLLGPALGRIPEPRPWLFCPCGIGGHVDHLAVSMAVAKNLPVLARSWRVAFYEDLHYASDARRRERGLEVFHGLVDPSALRRHAIELDADAVALKVRLIGLYESQLTPALRSIDRFIPRDSTTPRPHEAVWVLDEAWHQSCG